MAINDFAQRFVIDQWQARDIPDGYIDHMKARIEKDAIHAAVMQSGNDWIMVKPEWREKERDLLTGNYEYTFLVRCRKVETQRVYVYPEFYPVSLIPKDLYRCDYCGGHTYNDMRGHCCACGGPRKEYTWDH